MSLSTQLTRGTLALPMLALFGVLALVAGHSAEAETYQPAVPAVHVESEARALSGTEAPLLFEARAEAGCGAHARPQLLLAQAPGDLGPIAQRQASACRPAVSS
jgi:hypothetical protein